jgi:enoyl-CoA hydratase
MTAVSRGLNMSIAEGLQVEGEQFARLVPAVDAKQILTKVLAKISSHGWGGAGSTQIANHAG